MRIPFRVAHLLAMLKGFEQQPRPLDLFVHHYFTSHRALGSKDRAWLTECLYGMIRWRGILDWLTQEDPRWEVKFEYFQDPSFFSYLGSSQLPPWVRWNLPCVLYELLLDQYSEAEVSELARIFMTEAPTTVRVNLGKTSREEVLILLREYDPIPCIDSSVGIIFPRRLPLTSFPSFKEGLFEIQDEGSQLVAEKIPVLPGQCVLDYCAGSGGKSLAIAHKLQGKGRLFLHDVRESALLQAKKRLARAGIHHAQTITSQHLTYQKVIADVVILDVPCSGTGTFRRNPDMKWRFSLEMLDKLVWEQRGILEQGCQKVRKDGLIAYMTCSVLRQENEDQVEYACQHYGLQLIKQERIPLRERGSDGFFFALLGKK